MPDPRPPLDRRRPREAGERREMPPSYMAWIDRPTLRLLPGERELFERWAREGSHLIPDPATTRKPYR